MPAKKVLKQPPVDQSHGKCARREHQPQSNAMLASTGMSWLANASPTVNARRDVLVMTCDSTRPKVAVTATHRSKSSSSTTLDGLTHTMSRQLRTRAGSLSVLTIRRAGKCAQTNLSAAAPTASGTSLPVNASRKSFAWATCARQDQLSTHDWAANVKMRLSLEPIYIHRGPPRMTLGKLSMHHGLQQEPLISVTAALMRVK